MSTHPNVAVVEAMTQAVFGHDRDKLTELFTEDLAFRVRGTVPIAGDYTGVDGFLGAMGRLFELTGGDIKLEQLFCAGGGNWAAEWEHAVFTANGLAVEADDAFIYRFEGSRIAEIWLLSAAPPEQASFWASARHALEVPR